MLMRKSLNDVAWVLPNVTQIQSPTSSRQLTPFPSVNMPSVKSVVTAASTLRSRLSPSLRTRGGGDGLSRWSTPGHEDHPKGFLFNRTPPPPGQSRKWEDWELPCYITSFLTIVILGVGLNAKPDLTIETWAHQKALERLELESAQTAESD